MNTRNPAEFGSSPDDFLQPDEQSDPLPFGESWEVFLDTIDGRAQLVELIESKQPIPGISPLMPEEEQAFDNRYQDGFLNQLFLGEFELEAPLSQDDERELKTTTDARRRMILNFRKQIQQLEFGRQGKRNENE